MKLDDSPNCEKCGLEQTAIHVFTECPGFWQERLLYMGAPSLNHKDVKNITTRKIMKFADSTSYWTNLA